MRALSALLLALSLSGCVGGAEPPAEPVDRTPDVDAELDWKAVLDGFLGGLPEDSYQVPVWDVGESGAFVVDVREPEEYARGFIDNALNVPLRGLASSLALLPDRDAEILVVDETGHRSAVGMAVLRMLGYRGARSLSGGLEAWRTAARPLVTGPVSPGEPGESPDVDERLRAALDYYLGYDLPVDWGAMSPSALTEDQARLSSAEIEAQPETFDQGRSLIVDVDDAEAFARTGLEKSINLPLRGLAQGLDDMPLEETVQWA